MSDLTAFVAVIPDSVLVELYPDGAVLLDADNGACFEIDSIGSLFWQSIEQHPDLHTAHAYLNARFRVDADLLWHDLLEFCQRLADLGFLRPAKG